MTLPKILGLLSAFLGTLILSYVISPLIIYELVSQYKFSNYLTPVPPGYEYIYKKVLNTPDYTKASNWFKDGARPKEFGQTKVAFYTLSIPSLNINEATVSIGGEDLAESLIQYPGTALPGKKGNAVVFGHSILPQFFNPEDYLTIFSTLPTISKGAKIAVRFDGISYEYKVEDIFEVSPKDLQILEQNTSDSFITLITCVPPGHPLKPRRLVVRARIVPPER